MHTSQKHNLKRETQVILLMITDGEKWQYLAVKKLSTLLKGITTKHNGDFYCLNCFTSYSTKEKLKKHRNLCINHDYCYVKTPGKDNKILKYNYGEKSMKAPLIIYADIESLLEKINTCHNNPKKSSTTKINKHKASGNSLFTQCSFDKTKNKLDYYRGKDCMNKFFLDLKELVTKIKGLKRKKKRTGIISKKFVIYVKEYLLTIITMKNTIKSEVIVIILENTQVLLMIYAI